MDHQDNQHIDPKPMQAPPSNPHTFWKWVARIGLAFILALIGSQLVLKYYANEIFGRLIKEAIYSRSNGLYYLEYKDMGFNFMSQTLKVEELKLLPNRKQYYDSLSKSWSTRNDVFEAHIPSLQVKGLNIYSIAVNKALILKQVQLEKPLVRIFTQSANKTDTASLAPASRAISLLSGRISQVLSKEVNIRNGTFEMHSSNQQKRPSLILKNISAEALNFLIDSATILRDRRPFTVEDIHLTAGENRIVLPNSPYTLKFSSLEISTYGGLLDIKKLRLIASDEGKKDVQNGGKFSIIECEVPIVQGRGVAFRDLYFDRQLNMQLFSLEHPNIRIYRQGRTQGQPPRSIYPKLKKLLKLISVDQVALKNAAVTTHWLPKTRRSMPSRIDHISGTLQNFRIDERSHESRVRFFYIDHANLTIDGYKQALPDKQHTLKARQLKISTKENYLEVSGLNIYPIQKPEARKEANHAEAFGNISIELPLLKAKGVNLKKAYIQKAFELDYLLLYQPKGTLYRYHADSLIPAKQDSLVRIRDLYPFFSSFTPKLRLGFLDLREANFHLKQEWKDQEYAVDMDSLDVQIKQWHIAKGHTPSENDLFNAKSMGLHWKSIHLMRPDSLYGLTIGEGKISQEDSLISLKAIRLYPQMQKLKEAAGKKNATKALELHIDSLLINRIDFVNAYYRGEVNIDTLLLQRPELQWRQISAFHQPKLDDLTLEERIQQFLSQNFNTLNIRHLKLGNGNWGTSLIDSAQGLALSEIQFQLQGFRIDSATLSDPSVLFEVDSLALAFDSLHLPLPDSTHLLSVQRLDISSAKKTFTLKDVTLKPLPNIPQKNQEFLLYHSRFPHLSLKGVDMRRLYYRKEFVADTLCLPWIEFDLLLDAEDIARTEPLTTASLPNLDSLQQLILGPLKLEQLQHFSMDTLELTVHKQGKKIHRGQWEIHLDEWKARPSKKLKKNQLIPAKGLRANIYDFYQELGDSLYKIEGKKLSIDLAKETLEGSDLLIAPLQFTVGQADLHLQIPRVKINGLKAGSWYKEGGLKIDTFSVDKPTIAIDIPYENQNETRKAFQWRELSDYLPPILHELSIKKLNLRESNVFMQRHPSLDNFERYHLPHVNAFISGLMLDSSSLSQKKFLFSDTIIVEVRKQSYEVDSLHTFSFDSLRINTANKRLDLVNPQFRPIDTIGVYSKKIGHETDWISVAAHRISLLNWDMQGFVETQQFQASKLHIDRFSGSIYRDKRLADVTGMSPALPREALRDQGLSITLDSLSFSNGYVEYREQAIGAQKPGFIFINELNALVKNISNEPLKVKEWGSLMINAQFKLMGDGKIGVVFDMPLESESGNFYYEGELGKMDLRSLNPMLEPVANVKIRSGEAKSVRFKVAGNNEYATGIMRFYYDNLKIAVQNAKDNSDDGLLSFLANTFVVNRSNPHHLIFMRKGKIFFRRNEEKSLVHYWTKSLLSGVKSSIGLKNKEKPLKETEADLLEIVLNRFKLEEREKRKESRIQRKEVKEQLEKQQEK